MQIAQITAIEPKGSFESKYGVMYKFLVSFANGQIGECKAKSQTPAYRVGDQVGYDITGDFRGMAQLKIDAKAGQFQGGTTGQPPPYGQPQGHSPYEERKPTHTQPQAFRPSIPIPPNPHVDPVRPVHGATVGFAMKEAIGLVAAEKSDLSSNEFWAAVHEVASDVIRVSQMLEAGRLAPSVRERNEAKRAQNQAIQAAPRQAPQAGPGGSVDVSDFDATEENLPF